MPGRGGGPDARDRNLRLVRYKKAAAEEVESDSGDEVSTSFFAYQIQIVKIKSEARARKLNAFYFTFCTVKAKV